MRLTLIKFSLSLSNLVVVIFSYSGSHLQKAFQRRTNRKDAYDRTRISRSVQLFDMHLLLYLDGLSDRRRKKNHVVR